MKYFYELKDKRGKVIEYILSYEDNRDELLRQRYVSDIDEYLVINECELKQYAYNVIADDCEHFTNEQLTDMMKKISDELEYRQL